MHSLKIKTGKGAKSSIPVFFIHLIFNIFPFRGFYLRVFGITWAGNADLPAGNGFDFTDFAIVITLLQGIIIAKKHDLSPFFEHQCAWDRIGVLGKFA